MLSVTIVSENRKSDLEDEFEEFGDIKSIFVARNPPGFAYIEFYRDHDAKGKSALDSKMCILFESS